MQNNQEKTIIVALDRNNAIGNKQGLLFHLSGDLRRFKALTTGNTIIMGRKTFESLPKGALPNRRNIVVSRNPGFLAAGAEVAPSIEAALALAEGDSKVFFIGGGQIYKAALPLADTLELTLIDAAAPDADTYFPEIDMTRWQKVAESDPETESNPTYRFVTLKRK